MSIYQPCLVYGFQELNPHMILNWDFLNKNDMELYFMKSEAFYASQPVYGIKTDISQKTGIVRRNKLIKTLVDDFNQKMIEFCKANKMIPPSEPQILCVLEGELNYNLSVYSIQPLEYEGIKSTVFIEIGHVSASPEIIKQFTVAKIGEICNSDFSIEDYSNSDIEYMEQFMYNFNEDKNEDSDLESKLLSFSLDDTLPCMQCYKLVFYHAYKNESWANMRKIVSLETITEEHEDDSFKLNGTYVYFHILGRRAQIGNLWLNEGTIMDML